VECPAAVVGVVFRVEWPAAAAAAGVAEVALVAGDARSFPASVQTTVQLLTFEG